MFGGVLGARALQGNYLVTRKRKSTLRVLKDGPIGAMISQSIDLPQELVGLTEIMVNMFGKEVAPILEDMNFTMRPKSAERILVSEAGSRKKIAFLGVEHDAKKIMYNVFSRLYRQICKESRIYFEDSMVPAFLLTDVALKNREQSHAGIFHEASLALPEGSINATKLASMNTLIFKDEHTIHRRNLQEGRRFVECAKRLGILEGKLFTRSSLKLTTRVHRSHADNLTVILYY